MEKQLVIDQNSMIGRPPDAALTARRLGRNLNGYRGETLHLEQVLLAIQNSAKQAGWKSDCFHQAGPISLCGLHRAVPHPQKRVYLSTGIHGDEPAGPLAIQRLIQENDWPGHLDIWVCPCLNPTGFPLNTRENASGIDLNRDYRHLTTDEIRAHVRWLDQQPGFDLTLILHEDWEANGFYLYELNPDCQPSIAETIIAAVGQVCPIDTAPLIDGWPSQNGVIQPRILPHDRPQWPEAVYLVNHKTPVSYTLEAPSDFPLEVRVQAHVTAVRAALRALAAGLEI